MLNFEFNNPTKIVFGKDTELKVSDLVKDYSGKKVLLHYGGGSIKKIGLYEKVIKALKEADIDFVELGGVQPNPRLKLIHEGIKICKEENVDFILAVGGGSVIDSAKGIAVGAYYDGDVWDYYTRKAEIENALPIGVILTIPAAGSESSPASVVTREEGLLKRDIGTPLIIPKFAILNPELTFTLPPYQTSAGATDIMAHIMERYFTNVTNVGFTDKLCEATLKTIIENVPRVLEKPDDYNARAEIMWAGTIAHNGLLDTGRIGDWASHPIEHEISGIYDVAHGAGLAVVFPAWMKYVYKHNIDRFVQFAVKVWNVEYHPEHKEDIALEGIRRIEAFFTRIGMPTRLSQMDIDDTRFEEMAKKATENGPVGNFVKLDKADVEKIYTIAE
ncbi:MAG: iron-containing alcohol dehydrogenase [Eubacteriales bacterium]